VGNAERVFEPLISVKDVPPSKVLLKLNQSAGTLTPPTKTARDIKNVIKYFMILLG
jgi:hypothetical protein